MSLPYSIPMAMVTCSLLELKEDASPRHIGVLGLGKGAVDAEWTRHSVPPPKVIRPGRVIEERTPGSWAELGPGPGLVVWMA